MHEMTMIEEHEGTQVWKCNTCDYEIFVSFDDGNVPTVRVVEFGDITVKHPIVSTI